VYRMQDETGAAAADVVRAYLIVREAFGFVDLWQAIEALDYKIPDPVQTALIIDAGRLMLRATLWMLRNGRGHLGDLGRAIEHFGAGVKRVADLLPELLTPTEKSAYEAAAARLENEGVPAELARRAAGFDAVFGALDIVEVARAQSGDIDTVVRVHFSLSGELDFPWLRARVGMLGADDHWQARAKAALRDDLAAILRSLTADALQRPGTVAAWKERNAKRYERFRQILADLHATETPDLAMLSVAVRELRDLAS
jgi:glutamate dehydrogenase